MLGYKIHKKSFFLKHPNNLPLRLELGPIKVTHWLGDHTMQSLKPVGQTPQELPNSTITLIVELYDSVHFIV